MSKIIDRRANSKYKSAVNRQRFLQRFKKQIKQSISNTINQRSITDIERGEKITIPSKDMTEPQFQHGHGGIWEAVNSGNKKFTVGDQIKRTQESNEGLGSQASNTGEGWDESTFNLSREEFLELFFEDLALPNLVKKQLLMTPTIHKINAGFIKYGTPGNLSVIRSLRVARGRKIALGGSIKEKIIALEKKLIELVKIFPNSSSEIIQLKKEIETLKERHQKIPYIDPLDLRYHKHTEQLLPSTQAVMFCIMDVSGSMDEAKKEIAKRFFILLYLFLTRNYQKIELVFIRHHTIAKQVNEEEFFYSRETGGTVVSSAIELVIDIAQKRYPNNLWNLYVAQASDGDNWNADSPYCQELLLKQLMPLVQYYAYIEIKPRYHQSLWEAYLPIKSRFKNFAMQTIQELSDIYPALHELFKRDVI